MPNGPGGIVFLDMVATATQPTTEIRRCALCKIDRKGRFILADHAVQEILGLSEVELFGRPFLDFLDPADHSLLDEVTADRNPYDVVYDGIRVTMLDDTGKRTPVILIISTNFGNNTGNYQIVMFPDDDRAPVVQSKPDQGWLNLIDHLANFEGSEDIEHLVSLLHTATGCDAVMFYDTAADHAEVLAVAPAGAAKATSDRIANETPTDEIRATFCLPGGHPGLAIFKLDPNQAKSDQAKARKQAELAAIVLHSLCPQVASAQHKPGTPATALLPAELFDLLGHGTVLTGADGKIVQQNLTFDRLLSAPIELITLDGLIDLIGKRCGHEAAAAIRNYIKSSTACETAPVLGLTLRTGTGEALTLSLVRISPGTDDLSTCFLFSPSSLPIGASHGTDGLSFNFTKAAMALASSSLAATRTVWQKLEHEHHGQLTADGDFYINCLSHHLDSLAGQLGAIDQSLAKVGLSDAPTTTDLGLIFDKLIESVQTQYPQASISLKQTGLPKIKTQPRKLTEALSEVVGNAAVRAGDQTLVLTVTAELQAGVGVIWIRDDGPGLTKKQVRKIFTPTATPVSRSGAATGSDLALAQEILRSMGGTIGLESTKGKGTIVRITVPAK
jgi:PAS domain S-box-containing protein